MHAVSTVEKIIRDPGYAKRLEMACDASTHCPPMHKGRQAWIVSQFHSRFKESISPETVRKWYHGEAKPRLDKNVKLAQLLAVDPMWLYHGHDPELDPKERRARNAMADGAVNVVAGLIQMDGGYPAFPDEADRRAQEQKIDLYAIIKGANYALHITMGERQKDGTHFPVPANIDSVVVLGLVRDGFNMRIVEIEPEQIDAAKNKRGGSVTVVMSEREMKNHAVETFTQRL